MLKVKDFFFEKIKNEIVFENTSCSQRIKKINFDNYANGIAFNENNGVAFKTKHNKNIYIPDHQYRILIIGGSGSGKTN